MTAFDRAWSVVKMPYHGTNAESAKKIMEEGLIPRESEFSRHYGTPPVSFATKELWEAMHEYAIDEWDNDQIPAVIQISDDFPGLDTEVSGRWKLYDKTIPPEHLKLLWESPKNPPLTEGLDGGWNPRAWDEIIEEEIRRHENDEPF